MLAKEWWHRIKMGSKSGSDKCMSPEGKLLKNFAGVIGAIQACVGIVLAIYCLVYLYNPSGLSGIPSSFLEALALLDNLVYFNDAKLFNRQILRRNGFMAAAWFYLVLDTIWIATCVKVLVTKKGNINWTLRSWSGITIIISVMDFVLLAIVSSDYQQCKTNLKSVILYFLESNSDSDDDMSTIASLGSDSICIATVAPLFVVLSKGLILWIANVIFSILIIRLAKQSPVLPTKDRLRSMSGGTHLSDFEADDKSNVSHNTSRSKGPPAIGDLL